MNHRKKVKVLEIVAIFVIIALILLAVIPLIVKKITVSDEQKFLINSVGIYKIEIKKMQEAKEKDIIVNEYEKNINTVLMEDNTSLNYVVSYDEKDNMIYLCVSNGMFMYKLPNSEEKTITESDFTIENILVTKDSCFDSLEESDYNEK